MINSRLDNLWNSVGETAHVISIQKGLINLNDYITKGLYRIIGEVTYPPEVTNLPMMNHGGGNTIEAILWVLDSSLPNVGEKDDDVCVTQFLMLSNRTGGAEGDMFMRSANGKTKDSLTWKVWEKYQTNREVGMVTSLDEFVDNGIYSGVYNQGGQPTEIETFVMLVINNYVVVGENKTITQIKYANKVGGTFTMQKREKGIATGGQWTQWSASAVNNISAGVIMGEATAGNFFEVTKDANGNVRIEMIQNSLESGKIAIPYTTDVKQYVDKAIANAGGGGGVKDVRLGLIRGNASAGNFTTYTKNEDGSIALGLIYNEIDSGQIGVAYTSDVKTYVANQIKQAITDTLNKEV